jgi:pimeloyl-ACP methyl ester carboxylesterase
MTVTLLPADDPRGILLFAPGAGGDPTRYERLLTSAHKAGFIVASPSHDLTETFADAIVRERVVALGAALLKIDRDDLPVVAAGHSLGGCAVLCLAGAKPRNRAGERFDVPSEPRVSRVVVLAPATDWLSGPDALDEVSVPVTVFVGSEDDVTPPESAEVLRAAPAGFDLRTYEGVGHFDFMSPLPSNKVPTPGLDHDAFYERFTEDFIATLG